MDYLLLLQLTPLESIAYARVLEALTVSHPNENDPPDDAEIAATTETCVDEAAAICAERGLASDVDRPAAILRVVGAIFQLRDAHLLMTETQGTA